MNFGTSNSPISPQSLLRRCTGRRWLSASLATVLLLLLAGCHQDMWNQPRNAAHTSSDFFSDGSAARGQVAGTVQYDAARRKWADKVFAEITGESTVPSVMEDRFWTGQDTGGAFIPDNYFEVDEALLTRGRERYEINCAVCHGLTGDASGIVVQRGFPEPPSYHIDRLREVEDGYLFDVMTHGFGRMYPQAYNVQPEDRWAIAAYIRALQYSQNASLEKLTPEERASVLGTAEQPEDDDDTAVEDVH